MATTGTVNTSLMNIRTGTSPGTAITCAVDAELSVSNGTRTTTCKDSGQWEAILPGQTSWSMSGTGLLAHDATNGADELATIALAQTVTTVTYGTGVTGDPKYSGSAILTDFKQTSSGFNNNVEFSYTFTGTGQLTAGTFA